MHEKLVVVGNGMAGLACLERILERAPGRFDITVFGAEHHPGYNRILLSSVLAGEASWDDLTLRPLSWYADRGVTLHLGAAVVALDRARCIVTSATGIEAPYDELILATGSSAVVPPIPGRDLPGVVPFRTVDDCRRMVEAARTCRRAAVIGGGLLGLEAARGLRRLGMDVTVVHLVDRLMERQLDAPAAAYLKRAIRAQGIDVRLGTETVEIVGDTRVTGLRFRDGGALEADLVVMSVGIRPNVELARAAGLACGRGILVDDTLRTSDPRISAVGECAEHRGVVYGVVSPLYEQGRVLAARLAGDGTAAYTGSVVSTKLKVAGIDVYSGGDPEERPGREVLRWEDADAGVYQKVVLAEGRVVGAVLFGDLRSAARLDALLRSGERVTRDERRTLTGPPPGAGSAHGTSRSTGVPDPLALVRDLPDTAVVCGCNGVQKGAIVEAIRNRGLATRKEVAACTNASRSCGGCGPQVDLLLELVRGRLTQAPPPPTERPICDCTPLSRAAVVAAIRERRLLRVRDVLSALGWKTEGCSTCRPAVNYYLTLCWPGENEDDPAARLVNERVHANIQKDGTYSVVPRIHGGVVTPDELIRIGKVARKYRVPTVKITGGQRIDLLGVAKEQLPAIWQDLGMPSGFAYAKAVRTVKTCVGDTYCRYGTRDSMGLGIRLERTFENLWTPAKVKMAVNACPRNCAESLIKDVGLIGVEQGWEIYVGGCGGVEVVKAELLATAPDDDAAVELVKAFLQHYREEADYGDRTSQFVKKVGLDAIRSRVVDDPESRRALVRRMDHALARRIDPWRERVRRWQAGDAEVRREYGTVVVSFVDEAREEAVG